MKDVMTRMTLVKYFYFFRYNFSRLVLLNLITMIPLGMMAFGLYNTLPSIIDYFNSMNMAILEVDPSYEKAVFIAIARDDSKSDNITDLYMFEPEDFNSLRRYFFIPPYNKDKAEFLGEKAIGTAVVTFFDESITVKDKEGNPIATVWLSKVGKGTIEVMNYRKRREWNQMSFSQYTVLFLVGLILFGGMLGGISEYAQRMIYHEVRKFTYVFRAIWKHFVKSLVISIFLFIIFSIVVANIYLYIFLFSNDVSVFVAALNLWMLVFFMFILLWIFPFMVINSNESIWRLMRKSLFLSFDNFEYTVDVLLFVGVFAVLSLITAGIFPGVTGIFSFLSNSLKEISARYSKMDTA